MDYKGIKAITCNDQKHPETLMHHSRPNQITAISACSFSDESILGALSIVVRIQDSYSCGWCTHNRPRRPKTTVQSLQQSLGRCSSDSKYETLPLSGQSAVSTMINGASRNFWLIYTKSSCISCTCTLLYCKHPTKVTAGFRCLGRTANHSKHVPSSPCSRLKDVEGTSPE